MNFTFPIPQTELLDVQSAFQGTQVVNFDLSRKIIAADGYYPMLVGWPIGNTGNLTIAAFDTIEGSKPSIQAILKSKIRDRYPARLIKYMVP